MDPDHTTTGIFLGFTATDRTIWFEDLTKGELKSARHAVFNEAHYSANKRPPYTQELMTNMAEEHLATPIITPKPKLNSEILLKLKINSENTTSLPLHIIPNLEHDHSSLKQPPTTSDTPPVISLIPPVNKTPTHRYPLRSHQMTGALPDDTSTPLPPVDGTLHLIPLDDDKVVPSLIHSAAGVPEDFVLSTNLFGNSTDVTIPIKGNHPTIGLQLKIHTNTNRILLRKCTPSTPEARIL